MPEEILYIRSKVDKIDERLDSVDKTLAVNTQLLDIHIKRTNMLEEDMKTVKTHVTFVKGLGRLLAWLAGIITGVATVVATWRSL